MHPEKGLLQMAVGRVVKRELGGVCWAVGERKEEVDLVNVLVILVIQSSSELS